MTTIYTVKVNDELWGIYDDIQLAQDRADEGQIWDNKVEIYQHKVDLSGGELLTIKK
jgi:hypothetical protein